PVPVLRIGSAADCIRLSQGIKCRLPLSSSRRLETPGEDSNLRGQLRLLNIFQGNLDRVLVRGVPLRRPGGFSCGQIKCDAVSATGDQAPLPVAVIAYRPQG